MTLVFSLVFDRDRPKRFRGAGVGEDAILNDRLLIASKLALNPLKLSITNLRPSDGKACAIAA